MGLVDEYSTSGYPQKENGHPENKRTMREKKKKSRLKKAEESKKVYMQQKKIRLFVVLFRLAGIKNEKKSIKRAHEKMFL